MMMMRSRKIWYYRITLIILLFAMLLAWAPALLPASMSLSIAALRRLPPWTNRVSTLYSVLRRTGG